MDNTRTLETDRIILRKVTLNDLDDNNKLVDISIL